MDINCPVCGEPWDMDELHDDPSKTWEKATKEFAIRGMRVFDTSDNENPDREKEGISKAWFEVLG